MRVPLVDGTLVAVPEGLDDAVALLAGDILSTAAFGAELAGVSEGDLVVVVGCGPVGLLAILTALERGAREVVAVDRVPSRLAVAVNFGATPADFSAGDPLAVVRERSQGRGADAAWPSRPARSTTGTCAMPPAGAPPVTTWRLRWRWRYGTRPSSEP